MPSHTHNLPTGYYGDGNYYSGTFNGFKDKKGWLMNDPKTTNLIAYTGSLYTSFTGGDAGHSHNIPYISVYAWRRTA